VLVLPLVLLLLVVALVLALLLVVVVVVVLLLRAAIPRRGLLRAVPSRLPGYKLQTALQYKLQIIDDKLQTAL
jgi:hypothetical protein